MTNQVNHTAIDTTKQWLEMYFPNPIKWQGAQGTARCPLHNDRNPSFSINAEKGVWQCFVGCGSGTLRQLAEVLGVPAPPPVEFMREKERKRQTGMQPKRKTWTHETEYVYTDAQGNLVLMVGRDGHGKDKKFSQYHFKNGEWWVGKGDTEPIPYNLPHVLVAIANGETVFVVEGEKDADTLWDYGFVATTSANGGGNWPASKDFNKHFKGAKVVILPDNDETGAMHAERAAHSLKPYASSIKIVHLPGLPEKGDVTDWLNLGHTTKELLELVEKAEEWKPNKLVVLDGEKGNWLETRRKYFDGGRFVPPLLAEDILQRQSFMFYGQQLYAYVDGVYLPKGRELVYKWCIDLLGTEYRQHRGNEVLHYIEKKTIVDDAAVNQDDGLINVKNGLLNWRTGELLPHTPERLSTIQLSVIYDPDAICPNVEKFLRDSVVAEEILALLEFAGYCLVPNTKHQKAFLLTGQAGSGKSIFIKLLNSLIGEENTTSIPFQDLSENRFKRALLKGKLLNTFADISPRTVEDTHIFKAVVTGDAIDGEFKGRDAFMFKPFAKLLFSANELPGSKDTTAGFFRRWIIVNFPHRFEGTDREDKGLLDKLTTEEELSGFLNLALEGLRRLEKHGFTISETMRRAVEQYQEDVDNVTGFIKERCVIAKGTKVSQSELYQAYVNWCHKSGLKPLGKKKFNARLRAMPHVEEKTIKGWPFWAGCGLKETEEEDNVMYF